MGVRRVIDVDEPRSPGWWLKTLSKALVERNTSPGWRTSSLRREARPPLDLLADYLRGDPPLPQVAEGWRDGFRQFMRLSRMNYAELAVEPTRERMVPVGFHTAAEGDENGDPEAARIMRASDLDLKMTDVFSGMLALGDSYAIVGAPDGVTGVPLITAEDARQVITAHDPATGETLAALKMFRDDWDAADFAYVYLATGEVWKARRDGSSSLASLRFSARSWSWTSESPEKLPYRRIPVVRFQNRGGVGEFEPHLDVLDRINDGLLDRVVIAKIQAFRQRAIKNLPSHDEDGEEIDYTDVFSADPGALWQVPDGVDFWESQPIDLGPIRMAVKDDVEAFAAVTRTPLHLITPDAASGSAEGASLMREGQLYKVEDRRRRGGSSLAQLMSLAFLFAGDEARSERAEIKTIWQPAERYSLTEKMSAATQAKAAGLPQAAIFTDVMQYGPEDVARLESMRGGDLLYSLLNAPAPVAAQQQPQAVPAEPVEADV